MTVVVFRRIFDPHEGNGISWRLHGQALPQGSVPIRFILDDYPKLRLYDILAITEGSYRKNLDRATALGLIDNIIEDLIDRKPAFWDEYTHFIAEHLSDAIPLAVKDLSRSKWHDNFLSMLSGLLKAGANIHATYEGKTALDYAVEIREAIPYEWMSGNRDWVDHVIEALEKAGALSAALVTDFVI